MQKNEEKFFFLGKSKNIEEVLSGEVGGNQKMFPTRNQSPQSEYLSLKKSTIFEFFCFERNLDYNLEFQF